MALVASVLILATAALVVWFSQRGREVRRGQLRELQRVNRERWDLLTQIRREARLQLSAGNATFEYTLSLINEHEQKELTQ